MAKGKTKWSEAKNILRCSMCAKDIEIGEHYFSDNKGEPMHYYCYNLWMKAKAGRMEVPSDYGDEGKDEQSNKSILPYADTGGKTD